MRENNDKNDYPLVSRGSREAVVQQSTRRTRRRKGELITRTLPLRAREVRIGKTQELVPLPLLVERVSWLQDLVTNAVQAGLQQHWSEEDLLRLQEPGLSSYAFRAYQQAFGRFLSERAYYDSRVKWIIEETAGRMLRSTHYQRCATNILLARDAQGYVDPITRRNLQRRIDKFKKERGREPSDFFELNPSPPVISNPVLILSCVDKQFAKMSINAQKTTLMMDLKLPIVRRPLSVRDWEWHTLMLPIPEYVQTLLQENPENSIRLPSLRVRKNVASSSNEKSVFFDVPLETVAKPVHLEQLKQPSRRVLSFDWGERRLLTGTVLEIQEDGSVLEIAGPFTCDTRKAQARMMRQRTNARKINDKQKRIRRYYESQESGSHNSNPENDFLAANQQRVSALDTERSRNWAAHKQLQKQTGHHAARWAVSVALEFGCDTIAIEDLKSLEPRLKGLKNLRDRLHHQTRGQLIQYLGEKCQREGIKIVSVYAQGTSSLCPRCGSLHSHVKASDVPMISGRGWALCDCGSSLDRDHASSLCIGARALGGKTKKPSSATVRRRKNSQCKNKSETKEFLRKSSSRDRSASPKYKREVFVIDYSGTHRNLQQTGRALTSANPHYPSKNLSHSSFSRECLDGVRNRVTVASIIEQEKQTTAPHSISKCSINSTSWPGYGLMITNHKPRKTQENQQRYEPSNFPKRNFVKSS